MIDDNPLPTKTSIIIHVLYRQITLIQKSNAFVAFSAALEAEIEKQSFPSFVYTVLMQFKSRGTTVPYKYNINGGIDTRSAYQIYFWRNEIII